jgi:hypothetical protein
MPQLTLLVLMPLLMPEHKKDYCGSEGDGFLPRLISLLIRDTLFGVYLGECCKEHDLSWQDGANKAGDEDFKDCIRCEFKRKFKHKRLGLFVSGIYFLGVRIGGLAYKLKSKIEG